MAEKQLKKVKEIAKCDGCPFQKLFPENTFVAPKWGTGKRLVIAEAPGENEAEQGEPLVGGSGRLFNAFCSKAGIKRDSLTLLNCINCRPPDNVFPTDNAARNYISAEDADKVVSHCYKAHVEPVLKAQEWTRVDILGDKSLRLLTGKTDGITKWRGSPLAIPALGETPIAVPTLHPSYIMREQEMIPVVVNDLRKDTKQLPENYNLFPSLEDVQKFTAREFTFDIETRGWTREITMVGLSAEPTVVMVVPFRGAYITELQRIFREAKTVVGHNCIQFDLPVLSDSKVNVSSDCTVFDTMLMQHLCFPTLPHDLEFVASQFTNKPAWKHDKAIFELYCARDVDVTIQSFKQLKPMLAKYELLNLYHNVQVPLAKICKLMHDKGFTVNPKRIAEVREGLIKQSENEETYLPAELRSTTVMRNRRVPAPKGYKSPKSGKVVKYTHEPVPERVVPWRSPAIKQAYLYGKEEAWQLGQEPILDPKTGRITTGKSALDKLFKRVDPQHRRAIVALKNLNRWDELITTFYKEGAETQRDAVIHSSFNVHGTSTGRLSSSDPNLQNIPEAARVVYVPSVSGWRILEVDYSGIENRLQSYFAGDTERTKRLSIPGFSEHKYLASKISGVPMEQVEKSSDPESVYSKAKHVVHGVDRGLGAQKASNMYDIPLAEVKELFAVWKKEIAPTISWQNIIAEKARKDGFLRNAFGRMAWFYTSSYYTESLSFLPQGTGADVIYRAMIAMMYERIGLTEKDALRVAGVVKAIPSASDLLLQVHDSLVFQYAPEVEEELVTTVKMVMEQPWPELGGIVLPIAIKTGPSWGEVKTYKL